MEDFQILCVTMNQHDFSKIKEMNIHSNVVFANQADTTSFEEIQFEGHIAKMITTQTRGVGRNRNLALIYATGKICLFADDDLIYRDDLEETILQEFNKYPEADIIIFNVEVTSKGRTQKKYSKTRKCTPWEQMPWAGFRVAMRLDVIQRANIWYTPLFGGGCIFPSGEDSLWLYEARQKGLTLYVSKETIGSVSFETSTWFTGYDEKFFFGKGAYYKCTHSKTFYVWMIYMALRTTNMGTMSWKNKCKWMKYGKLGFEQMKSYYRMMDELNLEK